MSNRYRGPVINAFYQVSVHLAKRFQRRRLKYEKLTDNGRWMRSDGNSSYCLWQGELKTIFTL
jgi:nuclear transport factor 2 (NTF2) superfamily protein